MGGTFIFFQKFYHGVVVKCQFENFDRMRVKELPTSEPQFLILQVRLMIISCTQR